jgi:NADH dehydrogenase FAD-containing subunit
VADGDGCTRGIGARGVVVGAGFAGFGCLRELERLLPEGTVELVVVHPTDYLPYPPAWSGRTRSPFR